MKKLIRVLFLLGLLPAAGVAAEIVGIDPAVPAVTPAAETPAAVSAVADGLLAGKVLTGSTLRDLIAGEWLVGVQAPIYKKYYLSADFGLASPFDAASAHGFYYFGGRLWAGELLYDKVPFVRSAADNISIVATVLQYATAGGWGGRDFGAGIYRAGYDVGFACKFAATGYTKP